MMTVRQRISARHRAGGNLLTNEDPDNNCSLASEGLQGSTGHRPFHLEVWYGAGTTEVSESN